MMSPRQVGPGLLICLLAGCASQQATTSPTAVPTGPKAIIHAQYSGGMLNRQAEAVFKVEEGAYVMVGHLGGDGRFDILYPEDGRESGYVSGGKWFRTNQFAAYYDAVPQLYSFATLRYRSAGAQLDSYDGRGYGFIFLIASKRRLHFERISEFGLWNDLQAQNYEGVTDPRIMIKAFADQVAGDRPYTLKFARSAGSFANTTYADAAMDCALLSELGYTLYPSVWSSGLGYFSPSLMSAYPGVCGRNRANYAFAYSAVPSAQSSPATTPAGGSTLTRPPRRRIGDPPVGTSSFGNPTRRGAPRAGSTAENPSRAPRDWMGINAHRAADWDRGASPRSSYPRPDRGSTNTENVSTTRVTPVERAHPIERTETPRPVEATTAKPVIERDKP